MVKQLVVVWLVVAASIAIAAAVVPSVEIEGGVLPLLGVAVLFGLVNALIGPLLRLLARPLTGITCGLFSLVVNGVLLTVTAGLSDSLNVGGFLAAVLAAIVISAVTALLLLATARFLTAPPPQPAT